MLIKMIGAAALAVSVTLSGLAFAEDTTAKTKDHTTTEATGTPATDADFFNSPSARDFYTDDSMQSMRTKEEMAAAYAKMTPDAQAKMKVACAGTTDQKYSEACQAANAM